MVSIPRTALTLGAAAFLLSACATTTAGKRNQVLNGRTICIDAGHGGTAATDHFRVGPSGEREEWINLRVALFLKDLLEQRGARVLMTRTDDVAVDLKARATLAVDNKADVFVSIHHNATADRTVNFPIIYYHANASGNQAGVRLATLLGKRLVNELHGGRPPLSVVSDHTIFPNAGAAVLRHSYGIPGVIGEASFFSNAEEELRLKDPGYNRREATAYLQALEDFFLEPPPPMLDRYEGGKIEPLETLQEAERMQDVARQWRQDYERGLELVKSDAAASLEEALQLFSRSARSFPDSPIARNCHEQWAQLLERLGRNEEARLERRRLAEYYVIVE